MALQDYYDEEYEYYEPEEFLDDVEEAGKIPGHAGSGRSDEYLGFGEEGELGKGYIDWYLFLRTDDWDDGQDDMNGFWTNMDITIGADVMSPELLTEEMLDQAENISAFGLGTSPSIGYDTGNGFDERRPSDLSTIQRVIFDWYGVGDFHNASPDQSWDADYVAGVLGKSVDGWLDEAQDVLATAYSILNAS